jgi:hypothetical protein
MQIQLEATSQVTQVNGAEGRVWRGHTARGIEVIAVICGMEVVNRNEQRAYENELATSPNPHPASLRKVVAELDSNTSGTA